MSHHLVNRRTGGAPLPEGSWRSGHGPPSTPAPRICAPSIESRRATRQGWVSSPPRASSFSREPRNVLLAPRGGLMTASSSPPGLTHYRSLCYDPALVSDIRFPHRVMDFRAPFPPRGIAWRLTRAPTTLARLLLGVTSSCIRLRREQFESGQGNPSHSMNSCVAPRREGALLRER